LGSVKKGQKVKTGQTPGSGGGIHNLGANLSVDQGHETARLASLNALAAAQEHVGDLNAKGKS
jgi:hypothetical protein